VRSSLRRLSRCLAAAGHAASPPTVSRLLRERKYSLRVNSKQEAGADHPDRGEQFRYLEEKKQAFLAAGQPVISVDTKKKDLIGNFKNAGGGWALSGEPVNVHDFPGDAQGRAVPYGIYDLTRNRGTVYVGASGDTPRFAVDVVARWWETEGQRAFADAPELLVLADAGGSNGCRPRVWKQQL
jgi:Rhodopirellula transposase DDE domain